MKPVQHLGKAYIQQFYDTILGTGPQSIAKRSLDLQGYGGSSVLTDFLG